MNAVMAPHHETGTPNSLAAAIDLAVASEAAWAGATGKAEAEQLRHACVLWRIKAACIRGELQARVVGGEPSGSLRIGESGGGTAWRVIVGSLKCGERTVRRLEIMAQLVCDDRGTVVGAAAVKARQEAVKASMARHPQAWAMAGGTNASGVGTVGVHANHPILSMAPEAVMASGRRLELLGRAWLKACALSSDLVVTSGATGATGTQSASKASEYPRESEGAAPAMLGNDTERGEAAQCAGASDGGWEPEEGDGQFPNGQMAKWPNEGGDPESELQEDDDEDEAGAVGDSEVGGLNETRTAGEGCDASGPAASVCGAGTNGSEALPAAGQGERRDGRSPLPRLRLAGDQRQGPKAEQPTMDALWERAEKVLALAAELSACVVRGDREKAAHLMRELGAEALGR